MSSKMFTLIFLAMFSLPSLAQAVQPMPSSVRVALRWRLLAHSCRARAAGECGGASPGTDANSASLRAFLYHGTDWQCGPCARRRVQEPLRRDPLFSEDPPESLATVRRHGRRGDGAASA